MSHAWQFQEAKKKFNNLVECAQQEDPQIVTKYGKEAVVVLSVDDYKKNHQTEKSLINFLQESPLGDIELDLSRDKGTFL